MYKDPKDRKILIIEDNDGDYLLAEEYLSEKLLTPNLTRVETYAAFSNTMNAIGSKFDVILLDLTLDDKTGEALIHEAITLAKDTPIIVLTGYSDFNFALQTLALGISDYLLKDDLNPTILYNSILYNIERNKTLTRIKASEKQYSDLFHLSPLPMWIFNMDTLEFLDVNKAAINHYGYDAQDFSKMTIKDIRPVEELPMLEMSLEARKNKNPYPRCIFNHQKKDGSIIQVEINSTTIDFGTAKARLVLANDVTERLRHLKAIEQQNEKLRDIAWTQSHVLRAPLARIMGLADYLEDDALALEEKLEMLGHIVASAKELDGVVKTIVEKSEHIDLED